MVVPVFEIRVVEYHKLSVDRVFYESNIGVINFETFPQCVFRSKRVRGFKNDEIIQSKWLK